MRHSSDRLTAKQSPLLFQQGIQTRQASNNFLPSSHHTLAAQLGVSLDYGVLDKVVNDFISQNPTGTIINLGAGLDNRFFRLDNGQIQWFDIDVPETIELRHTFFETNDRYQLIPSNIFGRNLLKYLPPTSNSLIIIEGLAMYYPENKIKTLVQNICRHYSSCEIILEVIHPAVMDSIAYATPNLPLKWAVGNLQQIEKWHKKLFLAQEYHHLSSDSTSQNKYFRNITQPHEMIKLGHFKVG
ncbi:MAG TPA: hypothetical protein DCS93_35265 [Microscillaceae bacterium]|nr:hypothetical protein [Microscillaceae bacterium]